MEEKIEQSNEVDKKLRQTTEDDLEKEEVDNVGNTLNPDIYDKPDEAEKYKDLLLRTKAEFENYKKRTENEIQSYIKYASENVLKELLPVYDDICRSVESVEKGETKDYENLKQGIEMIKSKFWKVLQEEGITEINSFGQPFNVDTSTAMLQVERENTEPNTVVEV